MHRFIKCFIILMGQKLVWKLKRQLLREIEIKAARAYIKSVRGARNGVLVIVITLFALIFFMLGLILLHLAGAALLYQHNGNLIATANILLALGACYTIIPLFLIFHYTSQRTWIRWFHIRDVVQFTRRSGDVAPLNDSNEHNDDCNHKKGVNKPSQGV